MIFLRLMLIVGGDVYRNSIETRGSWDVKQVLDDSQAMLPAPKDFIAPNLPLQSGPSGLHAPF